MVRENNRIKYHYTSRSSIRKRTSLKSQTTWCCNCCQAKPQHGPHARQPRERHNRRARHGNDRRISSMSCNPLMTVCTRVLGIGGRVEEPASVRHSGYTCACAPSSEKPFLHPKRWEKKTRELQCHRQVKGDARYAPTEQNTPIQI
jgi:hypothetical protein